MERKAQLRFVCELSLPDPNESSVKTSLEKSIKGLSVTSIDNFAGEFIVTSNILDLILDSDSTKKDPREVARLKDEVVRLQAQQRILEEELAAVTQIKDHLARNYVSSKEANPEVRALTKRLQDTLKECQQINRDSAVTMEKSKALKKEMNKMEAEKNVLVEHIQQLTEKIKANEEAFKKIIESARESGSGELYELVRTYEEEIHKLVQNAASALTKEIIESSVKDSLTRKRRSSVIEELFKNYAGPAPKETATQEEMLKAAKKELSEKCEECEELEEAYNNLENEYQIAENQIEILQINLEEREKQIATLKEKAQASNSNQSASQATAISNLKAELSKAIKVAVSKDEQIKILKSSLEERNKEASVQLNTKASSAEDSKVKNSSPKTSRSLCNELLDRESLLTESSKKESVTNPAVVLKLKKDLSKSKLEIAELSCKLDETEDELKRHQQIVLEKEKELALLRGRLKDFEIFYDNPKILANTQKQLEEFKKKYSNSNKIPITSLAELEELRKENERLLKEYKELKMSLIAKEQQLMQHEKSNPLKDRSKKYMVVEEIRALLIDSLSIYRTLHTMAKELILEFQQKIDKSNECSKILDEYLKQRSKKERLKTVQELESAFIFLHCLPKKVSNIGILDKCVIDMLKMKISKTPVYKDCLFKYEKLLSVVAKKYDEYEQKLTFY
eukprot:TRINITY_DN5946_c0_g1_i4.p1 TRINITY_DN5946_c0_g1~~TRINITY_DN5946_c0_g1_i4.p1  ORF type:complete len:682 (+),score=236.10 TRINITY_DN5946_c0_g1_i4:160-2205(+)